MAASDITPESEIYFDVIPLSRDLSALVDYEDLELLSEYNWWAYRGWTGYYAVQGRKKGTKEIVYMHRVILGLGPDDPEVDHKDGDPLNNQKENLRLATRSQQLANSVKRPGTSSRYKGVTRHQGRWMAQIKVNGKHIYLGMFGDEEDAARAYDKAAKEAFGEFAKPNF